MEKLKQKTTPKIHQTESIRVRNSKSPPKLICPHRSEFNTYIRFHPPKHLPRDERSFSRNVASLKNMIQDKTNCSFESKVEHFGQLYEVFVPERVSISTNLYQEPQGRLINQPTLVLIQTISYQMIFVVNLNCFVPTTTVSSTKVS